MGNNHDVWNKQKKSIDALQTSPSAFPRKGEVWIVALGKNIGHEQDGGEMHFYRPVLVVKRFNNHIFWCIPLTSKQKELSFYFNYRDPYGYPVAAILAQLRVLSNKRFVRMEYVLSQAHLAIIRRKLIAYLK